MVLVVVLDHQVGHIHRPAPDRHLVGFVAAGPENGSAGGQNARQSVAVQPEGAVLHEPPEPVAETDHVHTVGTMSRLADAANGRIETGRIAPGGEDADVSIHIASTVSNMKDISLSAPAARF